MTDQANGALSADELAQQHFGIFNKTAEEVTTSSDDDKGPSPYFNPDSQKAPGKVYSAKIKFLPNLANHTKGTVDVQKYIVDNNGSKTHYKSAKSLGRYEDCPVAKEYWALNGKDQTDPRLKAVGKKVNWQSNTYALIQIIEDYSMPENTGKILIWNLPSDIIKLIEAERIPSASAVRAGKSGNNVFDPVLGRLLMLDIPIKTIAGKDGGKAKEVRDYVKCVFLDESKFPTNMLVNGETVQRPMPVAGTPEMQQFQIEVIKVLTDKDTLKLSDFGYKPETPEQTEKVVNIIKNMAAVATGQPMATQNVAQAMVQAPVQAEAPAPVQAEAPAPVQAEAPAPVQAEAPAPNQSDDIMSKIFNNAAGV